MFSYACLYNASKLIVLIHLFFSKTMPLMGKRVANENANGLIWQYFSKGMDFVDITQEQVMCV